MLSFLGALPIIGNIVTAITSSLFDAKVKITQARIGGDRDVAVELVRAAGIADQQRIAGLSVFASNKWLMVLLFAFAVPLVVFEWKVIIHDIVLGLGSTDPIRGQVAEWANTIVLFLFGTQTTLQLANMWFNRRSS